MTDKGTVTWTRFTGELPPPISGSSRSSPSKDGDNQVPLLQLGTADCALDKIAPAFEREAAAGRAAKIKGEIEVI